MLNLRRPLVEPDGCDLLERHQHAGAGHRDGQVLDIAGRNLISRRRTATSRDSPTGFTQSPTSTRRTPPQPARHHEIPSWLASAIELDAEFVLGSPERPTSPPGCHASSMYALVIP
jgi:hypothetical protein